MHRGVQFPCFWAWPAINITILNPRTTGCEALLGHIADRPVTSILGIAPAMMVVFGVEVNDHFW